MRDQIRRISRLIKSVVKQIRFIRFFALLIACFVLCTIVIGCVISTPETADGIKEPTGKLIIYSGRGETLVDPLIQQFRQATGIDVAIKYANTAELVATLEEEGERTPADIFFAQDPGGLGAVQDMFATLPPDLIGLVPQWASSSKGKWVGISGRARTVIYNPGTLSDDDLPDDMWGFVDPKWKGRIGWAPTNSSFQTMVTAMRSKWGDDKAREWIEGINANDPTVYPKNTPQIVAVAAGEIDIGFVNHYYLFRFLAEKGDTFPVRNYHPRSGGPGSVVMVAGVGILSGSENQGNAEKFVEFMLSKVAQQYFAGQTFEYPLVEGVKLNRLLIPFAEINHPNIGLDELSDIKGTVDMLRDTGVLP